MRAQGARSFERFSALLALEYLLRGVYGPVLRQTYLVTEGFVAELASERSLPVVRSPRVHLSMNFNI